MRISETMRYIDNSGLKTGPTFSSTARRISRVAATVLETLERSVASLRTSKARPAERDRWIDERGTQKPDGRAVTDGGVDRRACRSVVERASQRRRDEAGDTRPDEGETVACLERLGGGYVFCPLAAIQLERVDEDEPAEVQVTDSEYVATDAVVQLGEWC